MGETLDQAITRVETALTAIRAARMTQLTENATNVEFEGRRINRPLLATLREEETRLVHELNMYKGQKYDVDYLTGHTITLQDARRDDS